MAEIITKAPGVSFKHVHPTKTAGKKWYGAGENFVRCKQCGFPLNRDKHSKGSGWGNEVFSDITTIAGGTANVSDPSISAGCPLCGSSEYE